MSVWRQIHSSRWHLNCVSSMTLLCVMGFYISYIHMSISGSALQLYAWGQSLFRPIWGIDPTPHIYSNRVTHYLTVPGPLDYWASALTFDETWYKYSPRWHDVQTQLLNSYVSLRSISHFRSKVKLLIFLVQSTLILSRGRHQFLCQNITRLYSYSAQVEKKLLWSYQAIGNLRLTLKFVW